MNYKQDSKSLGERVKVRCPRCKKPWERWFEYGCFDKMPRGGLPWYYCPQCDKVLNGVLDAIHHGRDA